ncbi:MAG: AAA family ATPase [Deltaproteobacteria bacterium]|nr:AAA family ATPase [Deltaproteobacteria bacterium]
MKIKITDFGPIKEFEFDLNKSFVGIFGKNNTGKSYAISATYLILKQLINAYTGSRIDFSHKIKHSDEFKKLKKDLDDSLSFKQENNKTKEMESFFKDTVLKNFSEALTDPFYSTFGGLKNLKNKFSANSPKIVLSFNFFEAVFIIEEEIFTDKPIFKKDVIIEITKEAFELNKFEETKHILYASTKSAGTFDDNCDSYMESILSEFSDEISAAGSNVYYMPVARTGLYQALSSYSVIFAELSKQRRHITAKFEVPRLPEPVSDYFLSLAGIDVNQKVTIQKPKLYELIEDIEREIIKGTVFFDDKDQRIYYTPDNSDITIEILYASSMVSELAPIVLYLRHIIPYATDNENKNIFKPIIFIEEPEAHLHPKVQLQLTEIFCRLTKIGVKIVITSHSDYVFSKMNNSILSKELMPEEIEVSVFEDTETGSIVKKSKINQLGIYDDNFLEVAEELFEEKMNLIDKLNDEQNDR